MTGGSFNFQLPMGDGWGGYFITGTGTHSLDIILTGKVDHPFKVEQLYRSALFWYIQHVEPKFSLTIYYPLVSFYIVNAILIKCMKVLFLHFISVKYSATLINMLQPHNLYYSIIN